MVAARDREVYRRDVSKKGQLLTPKEREDLVKPYLPPVSSASPLPHKRRKSQPARTFLKTQFYLLIYTAIHTIFSLYVRIRQTYHAVYDRVFAVLYYHHRTPELIKKDVKGLNRLPKHLSVILELKEEQRGGAGLEGLIDDVSEISAWCACVGIPMLSIYEKTGILKGYIETTHRHISQKMHSYLGRRRPFLQIRAPHMPYYLNGDIYHSPPSSPTNNLGHLSILLLSSDDGRSTLVDLTKTLAEMSQRQKLSPEDISLDLIDAEIGESVMGEPDLLVVFGPFVELQGYPPWQVRLTEIFCVQDNTGVGYQVFLRALYSYAKAQMRFGR
ncbi:Decaprenyl diphosphate synthase-like [Lasallia pustulata]|uniref:ditrans,polycis-polyprenyl diphosphate synthase [(2E,6E)-farnesyldiphosphate specific] n=1 Tax=Lasallia pustulata TaxID=136370 RepID=A0A1W5D3J0_9LECA|nr:Decaprenyl diphosphate synthase-like [Lasallia pustulata]